MAVGVGLGTEVFAQGSEEVGEDCGLLRQNRPQVFLLKGGEREGRVKALEDEVPQKH